MNLAQMQMQYGQAPNGKVMLVPARPQIQLISLMRPRARQAEKRARSGDYRPRYLRAAHDCAWK